jgi:hypothetical protein
LLIRVSLLTGGAREIFNVLDQVSSKPPMQLVANEAGLRNYAISNKAPDGDPMDLKNTGDVVDVQELVWLGLPLRKERKRSFA